MRFAGATNSTISISLFSPIDLVRLEFAGIRQRSGFGLPRSAGFAEGGGGQGNRSPLRRQIVVDAEQLHRNVLAIVLANKLALFSAAFESALWVCCRDA
jgi:hypothetical protein